MPSCKLGHGQAKRAQPSSLCQRAAEARTPTSPPNSPAPPRDSDLGRSSTAATNVTYAVVVVRSTWSSTCTVNADPGATPHLGVIQMNCNHQQLRSATKQHDPCHWERLLFADEPVTKRFSSSVMSPAVLGFLIWFNARKTWSLRRRLESGIFFIAGSPSRRTG
jgi:hypothetical protein